MKTDKEKNNKKAITIMALMAAVLIGNFIFHKYISPKPESTEVSLYFDYTDDEKEPAAQEKTDEAVTVTGGVSLSFE
jgi:hypothetical protein